MKVHQRLYHHAKHAFIPHKHNEYKPHFFREFSIGLIIGISLLLLTVSIGSAVVLEQTDYGAQILPNVLIDLTNDHRLANGDSFLVHSQTLDTAASLKAEDMSREGYFAHTSPKGATPWHWFEKAGYTFLFAGENLAVNFVNSTDVENAWMNSPSHRANILNARFKEIGIAAHEGVYKDNPTIFVVQMFGVPAIKKDYPAQDIVINESNSIVPTVSKKNNSTAKDQAPLVKGESKEVLATNIPITETRLFSAVKNTLPVEEKKIEQSTTRYSVWYERILFNLSGYVDILYKGLFIIVIFALVLFIVIEIRVQHTKNLLYGVLLLIFLISCVYVNGAFALSHILFLRTFIGG